VHKSDRLGPVQFCYDLGTSRAAQPRKRASAGAETGTDAAAKR